MLRAICFGSIGTIAETSEIQRTSFNKAFREAGLGWEWGPDEYRRLLKMSGGEKRIRDYAKAKGDEVDASALHARKSELFRAEIMRGLEARPGVLETIAAARARNVPVAFTTTTSLENVMALLKGLRIGQDTFSFIGHRAAVREGKPSADIYRIALQKLGTHPNDIVAVEDSAVATRAAQIIGIPVVAFPGAMHQDDDFGDVVETVDRLSPALFGLKDAPQAA